MKKYLSYKDSEVGWIGEIPNTWKVSRVKKYFNERNEKVSDLDFPPLSVTKRGILPQLDNVSKSDNHNDRKRVCKNDFVINSRSDRKGSSGMSLLDGSVSLINIVLEPKSIIPKYSQYIFKSKDFIEEFFRNGKGIHWDLWSTRFSELQDIKIPIPPLSEQQQIVSFLDKKTSLIDSLIEKTQRKIELLKEKRTSLINEVVTKGLNPNVEMKNSGVEWIGEIPSHWETPQIRFVTELMRGKFTHRPRNDQRFYNGEYPFIQTGDIVSSGKYLTKFKQTLNERGYSVSKEFPIGTLVMTISGNIGDVSILKIKSCFPDSIIGFFPFDNTSVDYLYHVFNSLRQEFYKNSTVSTQMNLNVDRVGSIKIPLPSLLEQQQIVEYLDEQTGLIDKTISIEEKRIELLKEYRQSLISEVVTGKRKVVE